MWTLQEKLLRVVRCKLVDFFSVTFGCHDSCLCLRKVLPPFGWACGDIGILGNVLSFTFVDAHQITFTNNPGYTLDFRFNARSCLSETLQTFEQKY